MIDGIFHQRLEDKLETGQVKDLILCLHGISKLIFIAHVLNHKVVSHMLQLIPDSYDALSPAEADAEKPGQGRHDAHRVSQVLIFNHPHYDVQSVIQEMGVNLRLEGVELALSLGFMLRHNIVHKPPYLPGHVLYGIAQMLYLVGAAAPDLCLQITCLNFIDRFLQLLDWVCYPG